MKSGIRVLQALLFFLAGMKISAQDQSAVLNTNLLNQKKLVSISKPGWWKYKAGDDLSWANPDVAEEDWQPLNILLDRNEISAAWEGIGWFRATIRIDSALFGQEMGIIGFVRGAAEMYVNGIRVGAAGKVGSNKETEEATGYLEPILFKFSHQEKQTIAVRYSNFHAQSFWNKSFSGVDLFIGYPENTTRAYKSKQQSITTHTNRFYLIFGFMAALGLLHLILFSFYPAERANLTCALFFFSLGGVFLSGILCPRESSPTALICYTYIEGISLILSGIILPFFIYQINRLTLNWIPVTILLLGIATLVSLLLNPLTSIQFYFIFFLISTSIGISIVLYVRFILKKKEQNIILFFYLLSFILVLPGLAAIAFGHRILWSGNTFFMNVAAIPAAIGYSFYLARGVAITNRNLNDKLVENEKLNAEKLKAEIEKQQLIENQNKHLEKEVADRTMELRTSLNTLKATQTQLIQQEKLASLGELTAGIAHEIQNPLNFVNNFSEVNSELIVELKDELANGNMQSANDLAENIKENEEKIVFHGKRADSIVKSMLLHSRTGTGQKEITDINAMVDEYVRLAYHGMRAKDKSFNVDFKTELDPLLPKIKVIPQEIGRVLLNLINNAFQALGSAPAPKSPEGDFLFVPTVKVTTKRKSPSGDLGAEAGIEIRISDNGPGIPESIKDKIFQPFFTTKPAGQGTGLGLSLSYDIIKAHGGDLKVETKEGEGTTFIISLPA